MSSAPLLLIADDHSLIRIGLRTQLTHLGQFEVLEAWDQPSLFACVTKGLHIDLILLDVMMPGPDADGPWVEAFCARFPEQRVLLITGLPLDQVVRRFRHLPNILGAIGKGRPSGELREAVDLALMGQSVWPRSGHERALGDPQGSNSRAPALTARQRDVAGLVAGGLSNKDVAISLGLSEGTVKNHIKDIFRVLGVTNRTQLALKIAPVETADA